MSRCACEKPTELRATSENAGSSILYLRCAECGRKAGRVSVDEQDLKENVPDPADLGEDVTIIMEPHDSPMMAFDEDNKSPGDDVARAYGRREIDEQPYWVYTLECRERWRYDSYEDIQRRAENRLGSEPDWLRMAWEAERRLYVGQTEDLFKRVGEHLHQRRRTDFTVLFDPVEITTLYPEYTRNSAERMEERVAKQYYGKDGTFVYWN